MAWVEQVTTSVGLADRLSHRPSELSGGQQQRVAVARALVSRPTVMFADEPTGNLDSTTSGEILGLLRTSVDELGQTTVMVTHDAHAAAIADRVLFLADGDIVRDLPRCSAHKILETLEEVSAPMIGVALKGLAARKVRALLTALAVVIGVSMVSGTYILTDTMQKAFDGIFDSSYAQTDAVIGGKEIVKGSTSGSATVPESLLSEGQGAAGGRRRPAARSASTRRTSPRSSGVTASRSAARAAARRSGSPTTPPSRSSARSSSRAATGRTGRRRSSLDAGTAADEKFAVGDTVQVSTLGVRKDYEVDRHRDVRRRRLARRRDDGDLRSRDRRSLLHKEGVWDGISIQAKDGTSPAAAGEGRASRSSPPRCRSQDSAKQAEADSAETNSGLDFIRYFFLGFGGDRAVRRRRS